MNPRVNLPSLAQPKMSASVTNSELKDVRKIQPPTVVGLKINLPTSSSSKVDSGFNAIKKNNITSVSLNSISMNSSLLSTASDSAVRLKTKPQIILPTNIGSIDTVINLPPKIALNESNDNTKSLAAESEVEEVSLNKPTENIPPKTVDIPPVDGQEGAKLRPIIPSTIDNTTVPISTTINTPSTNTINKSKNARPGQQVMVPTRASIPESRPKIKEESITSQLIDDDGPDVPAEFVISEKQKLDALVYTRRMDLPDIEDFKMMLMEEEPDDDEEEFGVPLRTKDKSNDDQKDIEEKKSQILFGLLDVKPTLPEAPKEVLELIQQINLKKKLERKEQRRLEREAKREPDPEPVVVELPSEPVEEVEIINQYYIINYKYPYIISIFVIVVSMLVLLLNVLLFAKNAPSIIQAFPYKVIIPEPIIFINGQIINPQNIGDKYSVSALVQFDLNYYTEISSKKVRPKFLQNCSGLYKFDYEIKWQPFSIMNDGSTGFYVDDKSTVTFVVQCIYRKELYYSNEITWAFDFFDDL